jgi:2-succinyl-5-enolpyruvyl-6-hydroxy-3-cyclohexene-1-carboxylate synthase
MEVNHDTLARVGITPSALSAQLYALGYRSWKVGNSAGTSGPVTDLDSLGMRSNFSYRRSASRGNEGMDDTNCTALGTELLGTA